MDANRDAGQSDVDVAVLYGHIMPYVLMRLEELGFCGRGEAKDFTAGDTLILEGALPLNLTGAGSVRPISTA